jgi:hypothetical protein
LAISDYFSDDKLISNCCAFVANHLKRLREHPKFLQIKPEYFLKIIKASPFIVDHPEAGFDAILAWTEVYANGQEPPKTIKEIFYENVEGCRIIDYIPFNRFSKDVFMSKVLSLKILSQEDSNHCLEFYLRGNTPPTRFHDLTVKTINKAKAKLKWNIPLETFSAIGEWDNHKTIKAFNFNEFNWNLKLGKQDDFMVVAVDINSHAKNFEFFLEMGPIRYYTQPENQPDTAAFVDNGLFKNPNLFIKGVKIKLNRLERLDLDQGYVPLKIALFLKKNPPKTN